MKSGKRLENNIKTSCKYQSIFCERLKDNPSAFGDGKLRFTTNNIADYFIFRDGMLVFIESKNYKGASLPLTAIRDNQYDKMIEAVVHKGIYAGIFIFFEDYEESYFLPIQEIVEFKRKYERKSIPRDYFKSNGIEVSNTKKKTNYQFNFNILLTSLKNYDTI